MTPSMDAKASRVTTNLKREFRRLGRDVQGAVPAFTGLYPMFGGLGNWELLFTKSRVLAFEGDVVAVWAAYSGPVPTKHLASHEPGEFMFRGARRRYDSIWLSSRRYWVHRRYRSTVESLLSPKDPPAGKT